MTAKMGYRFNYQNPLNVGNPVAEQEKDFLCDHFVRIPINTTVHNKDSNIILGRKGVGKSALRIFFEKTHDVSNVVLSIYPEPRELDVLHKYLTSFSSSDSFSTEAQTIWEIAFYISIMRGIVRYDDDCVTSVQVLEFLEKYDVGVDELSVQDTLMSSILFMKSLSEISDIPFLSAHKLIFKMRKLVVEHVNQSEKRFFILIDSVDDNMADEIDTTGGPDIYKVYFQGLLEFFRMFVNREAETLGDRVNIKLFIPGDVLSWAGGRNEDHIESKCHNVRWDADLIETMIIERLKSNVPQRVLNRLNSASDREMRDSIWSMFLPDTFNLASKSLHVASPNPKSTSREILSLCINRPRDIIRIIKEIDDAAKQRGIEFPDQMILEAVFRQHSNRLRALVEHEYSSVFPEMNSLLGMFTGHRESISKTDLSSLIAGVVGMEDAAVQRAAHVLYNASIIGAHSVSDRGGTMIVSGYPALFSDSGTDFATVWAHKNFVFHQAFHHALQLRYRD